MSETHEHDYQIRPVGERGPDGLRNTAIRCDCGAETTMDKLPLAAAMRAMGLEIEITDVDTGVTMTYKDKGEN